MFAVWGECVALLCFPAVFVEICLAKLMTSCFGNGPDCFLFLTKEHIYPPNTLLFVLSSGEESWATKVFEMLAQQHRVGSVSNQWVSGNLSNRNVFTSCFCPHFVGLFLFVALGEDLELSTERKRLGIY